MNRFIIYGILLLVYLGLTKSFSPGEYGISYVNSNEGISELVNGTPLSVILADIHTTGFLIKTYYHKYKIVYGYQSYEELIVRTSPLFSNQQKKFLGMSVFRRSRDNQFISFVPMPPGSIFIDDKNLGRWVKHPSGQKVWSFFRPYRNIPRYLGWNNFLPSKAVLNEIKTHEETGKPFFGEKKEFGLEGFITKDSFPDFFKRKNKNQFSPKELIQQYFNETFSKKNI